MTERQDRREPRGDRARKRAIRARAAEAGVPYSVAARQTGPDARANDSVRASRGRTVYPTTGDSHRQAWVDARSRRSLAECVRDARRAGLLPSGRAAHLVERFPPSRGIPKAGVGLLYHGAGREDALAMVYLAICRESPGLVPPAGDLAWIAEMGEETAVDMACAEIDRAARRFLDGNHGAVCQKCEAALRAGASSDDWHLRSEAIRLHRLFEVMLTSYDGPDGEPYVGGPPLVGVRQILDALLVVADDGHAPGTRVRMLAAPFAGQTGTIVGMQWGPVGPPTAYDVHPDGAHIGAVTAEPTMLLVLADQEALPG